MQKQNEYSSPLLDRRKRSVRLVITCTFVFIFTTMAARFFSELFKYFHSTTYVLITYLVFIFPIASYFLIRARLPLHAYGLTVNNAKRAFWEALHLTIILIIVLIFLKFVAISTIPAYQHLPLFDIYNLEGMDSMEISKRPNVLLISSIAYIIGGFFQELLARGVLQGQLDELFFSKKSPWYAIIISNLIFASLHVLWSFQLTVIAFIFGLMWGRMYSRHRNIIGVSLSHILLGICGFKLLNIPSIYNINPF